MSKPASNSKKSKRGGSRPGAGRPAKADANEKLVADALEALDLAMKARDRDGFYTAEQRRWHMAMVLLGVRPEVTAPALFRPGVADAFAATIRNAVRTVEVCQGAIRG